jgi:hypothetical protein
MDILADSFQLVSREGVSECLKTFTYILILLVYNLILTCLCSFASGLLEQACDSKSREVSTLRRWSKCHIMAACSPASRHTGRDACCCRGRAPPPVCGVPQKWNDPGSGVNCYDTLRLILLIRLPTARSTTQVLIATQDASEYRAASHESLAVQKLIPFLNLCCCLRNSCFLVQSKETPPQFK